MSAPGRSLTNCSASAETTRSSEPSRNGSASSSAATAGASCAVTSGLAAISVPMEVSPVNAARTASVGVPRSTAISNCRRTAPRRSARSAATRSIRNVSAPSARARRLRPRNKGRSKMIGLPDIPTPPRRRYRIAMDTAATVEPSRLARIARGVRVGLRTGTRLVTRLGLDLALPRLCPSCRDLVTDDGLCPTCWGKLAFIAPPYCPRLGIPFVYDPGPGILSMQAIADPQAYNRARAAVRFEDVSRKLVHAFKYGDRLDLAPLMGRWMAHAGRELLEEADALVPVPLHWRRMWARRFNQSAALAKIVSQASGVAVVGDALKRVKPTLQQVGLTASERALNVQGAFAVADRSRVAGGRLILIDDVLTSGATIDACARALNRAGAAAVDVLVFARVVDTGRSPI